MKRRNFLGTLAALTLGPVIQPAPPINLGKLGGCDIQAALMANMIRDIQRDEDARFIATVEAVMSGNQR